jgi:hypothetical protein
MSAWRAITHAWITQYAESKLNGDDKASRYIERAKTDVYMPGKLQKVCMEENALTTAECLGSNSEVYQVQVKADLEIRETFTTCCTCLSHSSDGLCKHALALMLWIARHQSNAAAAIPHTATSSLAVLKPPKRRTLPLSFTKQPLAAAAAAGQQLSALDDPLQHAAGHSLAEDGDGDAPPCTQPVVKKSRPNKALATSSAAAAAAVACSLPSRKRLAVQQPSQQRQRRQQQQQQPTPHLAVKHSKTQHGDADTAVRPGALAAGCVSSRSWQLLPSAAMLHLADDLHELARQCKAVLDVEQSGWSEASWAAPPARPPLSAPADQQKSEQPAPDIMMASGYTNITRQEAAAGNQQHITGSDGFEPELSLSQLKTALQQQEQQQQQQHRARSMATPFPLQGDSQVAQAATVPAAQQQQQQQQVPLLEATSPRALQPGQQQQQQVPPAAGGHSVAPNAAAPVLMHQQTAVAAIDGGAGSAAAAATLLPQPPQQMERKSRHLSKLLQDLLY